MSFELDVLRAFLRLARRRTRPSLDQLVVRVGGEEPAVRDALKLLTRQGLLQRTSAGLSLSMAGLAVAVACAQRPAPVRSVAKAKIVRRNERRAA